MKQRGRRKEDSSLLHHRRTTFEVISSALHVTKNEAKIANREEQEDGQRKNETESHIIAIVGRTAERIGRYFSLSNKRVIFTDDHLL